MIERARTAGNYRDIPIDLQDPRNRETLVDARDSGWRRKITIPE
jgi:hypothetical protein